MIQASQNHVYTDEVRMQEDYWDLRTFSAWNNPENRGVERSGKDAPILDFRIIKNKKVRQEVKEYNRYIILKRIKKLKTICTQRYRERFLWLFINTLPLKETILEIPLENLVIDFRDYLLRHTKLNTVSVIETVGSGQKIKCYVEDSTSVNSIKQLYRYLLNRQQAQVPEIEKDIWDIRNLPFYVEISKSRARHMVNFTRIIQENMRDVVKVYVYERLKVRKLNCVYDDLKALNYFSCYLARYHPDITAFNQLTRNVLDEYMVYLNKQDMTETTKRARAGYLRTFFKLARFLEICDMPEEILIPYGNLYKRTRHVYKIIPDSAMEALNEHLDELPREIRMMTLLLEYVGMRINECCQLQVDCLKYDSAGAAFLEYFQSKTSQMNRVPLSNFLEKEIVQQQMRVRKEYPEARYLLTSDGIHPVGQEAFSFHVNRLAYHYRITDEEGRLFRFKSHQFRHTLATKYALGGMSPNMIRALLGHQDIRSIQYYIDMRDTIRNEQLQAFLKKEEQEYVILRQKADNVQSSAIPMMHGYCHKQDLCEAALACYSCGMFHMGVEDQNNNRAYLQMLMKKKEEAKRMGFERQQELYEKMITIISEALEHGSKETG